MAHCFETLELGMCIYSSVAHKQILFLFWCSLPGVLIAVEKLIEPVAVQSGSMVVVFFGKQDDAEPVMVLDERRHADGRTG